MMKDRLRIVLLAAGFATLGACGGGTAAVDPCEGVTCSDHGTCDDSTGVALCQCDTGYAGAACDECDAGFHDEAGTCVINETCMTGQCEPNGTCDDSTGVVQCDCDSGFIASENECIAPPAFSYTGAEQQWTVPEGVASITIDLRGAQGGAGFNGGAGGLGGRVQATLAVTPGDVLYVNLGGAGAVVGPGGFNGGGTGVAGSATAYGGGSGGGASDIRINGTVLSDRKVVAGGGGGGGGDGCNAQSLAGGAGGGLTAEAGAPGTLCLCNPSGQAGTAVAGGAKGEWACEPNCDSTDGALGQGGDGNSSSSCGGTTGGGGGGGGYFGGGGGGLGAGGGGSSYADPAATAVTHTQGFQSGNGAVTFSW